MVISEHAVVGRGAERIQCIASLVAVAAIPITNAENLAKGIVRRPRNLSCLLLPGDNGRVVGGVAAVRDQVDGAVVVVRVVVVYREATAEGIVDDYRDRIGPVKRP